MVWGFYAEQVQIFWKFTFHVKLNQALSEKKKLDLKNSHSIDLHWTNMAKFLYVSGNLLATIAVQ